MIAYDVLERDARLVQRARVSGKLLARRVHQVRQSVRHVEHLVRSLVRLPPQKDGLARRELLARECLLVPHDPATGER